MIGRFRRSQPELLPREAGGERWLVVVIAVLCFLASIAAVVLLYAVGRALAGWRTGLLAAAMWAVLPRALVLGHDVVGPLRGDRYGYLEPFMVVALLGATLAGWRWVQ